MVEGSAAKGSEVNESDAPSNKENNKERLDTKEAQKKLNDILFGDDGETSDTKNTSDSGEKFNESDANNEGKDTNDVDDSKENQTSGSFKDFVNKLFADDMGDSADASDSSESDTEEGADKTDGEKNNEQKVFHHSVIFWLKMLKLQN